ncbi:hypothetical protein ACNKHS_01255 [Shigella flexneri]
MDEARCWPVAPGESWHGFPDADADHIFLDPVKVTILTRGICDSGVMGGGDPGCAGGEVPG